MGLEGWRKLRDECDKLFAIFIKSRDNYTCQNCGSTERPQCAHLISRAAYPVRFDPKNAVCLCARCHRYFTDRQVLWDEWIVKRIGQPAYDLLRMKSLASKSGIDYTLLRIWLEQQIEKHRGYAPLRREGP